MTFNTLLELTDRCAGSVSIGINKHKNCYQSIDSYLDELVENDNASNLDDALRHLIIDTNSVIELYFYPNSPIGFCSIVHYDLSEAIQLALNYLNRISHES